jgi:dephospho-CoA kinase
MPGAGKSTVANIAQSMSFEMINMGDAVREEARRQKLDPSDANLGKIMLALRKKYGQAAVAELCAEKIKNSKSSYFVIDGIRSTHEIDIFKKLGNVILVSIQASPSTRLSFLTSRKRKDAPMNDKSFEERDSRELKVGIGEAIALADFVIVNNGITINELKKKAEDFLNHVKEKRR